MRAPLDKAAKLRCLLDITVWSVDVYRLLSEDGRDDGASTRDKASKNHAVDCGRV
jgi:hypothetical protein